MKTTNVKSEEWQQLVTDARAQLAAAEADFTREKSRVEAVQAGLFRQLRGQYQKRDRLRLAVDYRQKFLDSFIRDCPEEAEQAEKDLPAAKAQLDQDYEAMAVAADRQQPLTAGQEAELTPIWQKLVKLHHPDSFADEPEKQETYHQLTAVIHQAKHSGDTEMLRKIAEDPEGFQLEHGWTRLDFADVKEQAQLKRLHDTLQEEIAAVTKLLKELRASPDYELCQRADQKPGLLDELVAERTRLLEAEITDLEKLVDERAAEIKKLSGQILTH
jgi:DNA polymerase-3 subunit epsilon